MTTYVARLGRAAVHIQAHGGDSTLDDEHDFVWMCAPPCRLNRVTVSKTLEPGRRHDYGFGNYTRDMDRIVGGAMIVHDGEVTVLTWDDQVWLHPDLRTVDDFSGQWRAATDRIVRRVRLETARARCDPLAVPYDVDTVRDL